MEDTRVTAGVLYDAVGRILVARRAPGERLAGKWEFPGGKIEAGESAEFCLARELREELGIEIRVGRFVASSRFAYDHVSIELLAYEAEIIAGEPSPTVHDRIDWVAPEKLNAIDLAPADLPIVEAILEARSTQE